MKYLVTGSRDFTDRAFVHDKLDHLHIHAAPVILIHGGARGADHFAHEWALSNRGIYEIEMPAKWDLLGKGAGSARNSAMVELMPDRVLAFFKVGAANIGTKNMVSQCRLRGIREIAEYWCE